MCMGEGAYIVIYVHRSKTNLMESALSLYHVSSRTTEVPTLEQHVSSPAGPTPWPQTATLE